MKRPRGIWGVLSMSVVLLFSALADTAGADTLTLASSPTTVPGGGTVTIAVGGTVTTTDTGLELVAEPVANTCAPTFDANFESLTAAALPLVTNTGRFEPGPLSVSVPVSIELAPRFTPGGGSPLATIVASVGEYRVCGYLETITVKNESVLLATAATSFGVRAPADSISLAPTFSSASERYAVPIGYTIEPGTTPVSIVVNFYPMFPIEGERYDCVHPEIYKSFEPPQGSGTLSFPIEHGSPGNYGLCVRVFNRPLPTVELANASMAITVGSSAHGSPGSSGCVVPRLARKTLAAARRALVRAHCRLGRVKHHHRAGHRRGTVLSQSARPGAHLHAGARVGVVLAS